MKAKIDELFEYLSSKSLGRYDNKGFLRTLDNDKIIDILENITRIIIDNETISRSKYNYSCNSELSGGRFSCTNLRCRISNIDKLARFAIFYADSIIILNPFEEYRHKDVLDDIDRDRLIDDLELLYYMQPLLSANIIRFSSGMILLCKKCNKKIIKDKNKFKKRLNALRNDIINEYLKKVKITYTNRYGEPPRLLLEGDDEYAPHGSMIALIARDEYRKRLSELFDTSIDHTLSKNEVKKMGIIEELFTNRIFQDIYSQSWLGKNYNTQYVTNRALDFKILKKFNEKDLNIQCNAIMEGILHSVPYIYNIDLEQLIDFRNAEMDSFIIYREAVNKVLASSGGLNSKQVKEAFEDFVKKELHKIDLVVKKSKKNLAKNAMREVLIGGALVTAGVFSNTLSPELAAIATAVGGLKYLHQFCCKTAQIFDEPLDAAKNDIYFLWKVKEAFK